MTSVAHEIDRLALFHQCPLCGAQPQENCHVQGQPKSIRFYPHKMRTQSLWNVYSAGFNRAIEATQP